MLPEDEEAREVQEYCEEIGCQVPFLTREELHALGAGLLLGEGGNGSVRLVRLENGGLAVVKELLVADQLLPVLREASFMLQLGGAGGAPRLLGKLCCHACRRREALILHELYVAIVRGVEWRDLRCMGVCVAGVCHSPPALVQEFVGHTYDKYLEVCSVNGFLASLQAVCQCLEEVHAKGVVHNDLKCNNITFSGLVSEPHFHIIDFGWASSSGSVVVEKQEEESDEDSCSEEEEGSCSRQAPWMAPEVFGGRRVFPSGDVYSLGVLMDRLMDRCPHGFLTGPIMSLSRSCTVLEASRRPSLSRVAHCLAILARSLTPHQLAQYFEGVQQQEEEEKEEGDQYEE